MTIVVKLGGRVQSDPRLAAAIGGHWKSEPSSICIVHGGGDDVSVLQRQLGREPVFVNGRRVTTSEDLDLVRMVLSGSANKRLVAALIGAGVPAVGISGEDAELLSAEPIDAEKFGRAGKPVAADVGVVRALLTNGFLPVISPLARDSTSRANEALNVNGDDAAAAIASALGAELWLIADVEGVLDEDGSVIRHLDASHLDTLVANGTVNSGMLAKLEAAFTALGSGCPAVRVASLDAFSSDSGGTIVSLSPSMR